MFARPLSYCALRIRSAARPYQTSKEYHRLCHPLIYQALSNPVPLKFHPTPASVQIKISFNCFAAACDITLVRYPLYFCQSDAGLPFEWGFAKSPY